VPKQLKIFLIEDFFHWLDTGGAPCAANIFATLRKYSKQPKWETQGLGGTGHEKPEVENLVALSLWNHFFSSDFCQDAGMKL
jgi:hypothetical protein